MAKTAKGNTAIAAAMAKAQGPQRPDFVPQENWDEMTDEQKAYCANPANWEVVKATYADDDESEGDKTPQTDEQKVESVAMAVSEDFIPTSFVNLTNDLSEKINDQDRAAFAEAVESDLVAKVRTIALFCVIERAYGPGANALPLYGTTAKDSNAPDVFEYKKRNSKGKLAKNASTASVLEITAYKAMVPLGMHNEIRDIEKKIAALGKKPVVPFAWSTRLDELRERRNKLIKKFIFVTRLAQTLAAIAGMKKVGWRWIANDGSTDVADDLSNLSPANTCILLHSKNADGSMGGMSAALSPGTVIDYRVALSEQQAFSDNLLAGTLDNLLASADPGTPEASEGEEEIEVPTFAEGTKVLRAFQKWITQYIGPSASKANIAAFKNNVMSEAGSELLARIFETIEMCEEGVTSNPEYRSKYGRDTARINRETGGEKVKVA